MNFRDERTYWIAGAVALGLALAFSIHSILQEREARIRLEEQIRATHQLLSDKDRAIERLDLHMAENDASLKRSLKEIEALKARPLPVREIIKEIQRYIPMEPPTVVELPGTDPESPAPNPGAVFDAAQLTSLREFYLNCTADRARLGACQDNLKIWREKELTWQEKETILEQQRDAAIQTAKGGSFWRRAWDKTKWFGVGVVAGTAIGVAAGR